MKRCPISCVTRKMKPKTIIRFHFYPLVLSNKAKLSVGKDVEKFESSSIAGGTVKGYGFFGKHLCTPKYVKHIIIMLPNNCQYIWELKQIVVQHCLQ